MLILFAKSQLALFDAPVNVAAHVRKDGTAVKPHTRIQKVAVRQASLFDHPAAQASAPAAPRKSKLDVFLTRYGGAAGMAKILAGLTEGQQQQLIAKMAEVGKTTPAAVAEMLAQGAAKPAEQDKGDTLDLFSQPHEPEKAEEAATKPEPEKPATPEPASGRRWRYALPMRPPAPGAVPSGFVAHDQDTSIQAARHGVLTYSRELSPEEVKQYELVPLGADDAPLELPKLPDAVRRQVEDATSNLQYIAKEVRSGGAKLSDYTDDIKEHLDKLRIFGEYAARKNIDKDKVLAELGGVPEIREPAKTEEVASQPEKVEAKTEELPPEPDLPLVEYRTAKKGKVLRGVVRTDLTEAQARAIDPYTMRYQGGWFIREKHLKNKPTRTADANTTDRNAIVDTGDRLADYWANSAGASIERDVKAGRSKKVVLDKKAPEPAPEPKPEPAQSVTHDPMAPFGVKAGTSKTRRREINAGVAARIAEGGPYTAEDLAQFRQYSGNGGCGDSLNEFYTDPGVARAMWTAIGNMGITHGTGFEPSCATGVFLHTAPAGFKVTGVELDPTSAAVASALHGDRHEIHTASLERFATTDDRQFDVVIGNPPYGPRGFLAKDDKKAIATAEQYFTDTALDKCRAGGIVALVVPTGIMDSKSARSFRQSLLCKGEFLGAQRMPNTAFEHSHTEVTTDVVYFRKRPEDVAAALGTVDQITMQKVGAWDEEFLAGTYFTGRGSENVLGTMTEGWRAKAGMGNDITVEGSMDGVADAIANFSPENPQPVTMHQVLEALDSEEDRDRATSAAFRRPYANAAKVGDTRVVDGVTYVLQGEPPRWHRVDEFMQTEAITAAQSIAAEIETLMTGSGGVNRPALEARVRAYVEKHGIPANDPDLMTAASVDKTLYRLIGAVNREGQLSDAVLGKAAKKIEGGFDATAEILSLEHDGGTFKAGELAERLGKELDEVIDQLAADSKYAYAGGGQWTTMQAYLTGELWPKLDAARAALESGAEPDMADKRRLQIERLEETIGPKSLDDVDLQLNSAFLPLHVLEAYFNWRQFESPDANDWTKKQKPVEITFADGVYRVTGGNEWGDSKLLDKYLNRTGIRKEEDKPRIDALNEEFKTWLCGSQYRDSVEDLYNRTFRGFVAPEFSNQPMDVPGLATDKTVRDWRWSSLRKSLATGKGIIADDVGLGKTLGGLLLARMAVAQGRAKKPVIVVPKSVLANWYEESQAWFPGSRVLTVGANFARGKNGELIGKDDTAGERKRKYHDLTQNDYDFILISEPAFEEIDLDPETKEKYYGDDFWVQRGESLGNAGDKRRKAIRERYEQHIAQREFSDRTDAIWFNELGIDMLIADEMHHQKNLYAARARFGEQPKFLGGQGLSNRALDFNLKTRWVRENNGEKNVFGLTATPSKNSPLEIYSMLSHIAPEEFERRKIRNSEEFLDRFCEFVGDKVLSTSGQIEDALVVSGFKNLDELREIMAKYIDRRTAEMVGLKLPDRDDRMHLVDMTPAQQAVYADLRDLAEESSKKDATGDAHIFSVMDKMNKAALDLSLLDPKAHAGAASPKYAELAKQCREGAKEGGQIVFSEYIDSHDKIVAALVDAGFKRDEIGIINAQVAGSAVKRQNIANAFNAGKLKVVVGNCTMAEGLNMQKTTTDIHHLDVPWEPATLQQRNGRGLRQGNLNAAVRIHTYLSKGSFDGYRYQAVAAKKDWQDLLWSGGDKVENLAREGKFSREEMRIMLSADPEEARKKFEDDKAEATARYEAGKRSDAQATFVRFVEMSQSYSALKNKDSTSARRLRQTMESLKTSLFNNKYWPDKSSLDSKTDVLIHPQTGTVLKTDQGLDFGADGKMVVTGVNMRAGTVTMRRYANTSGGGKVTVKLDDIADAKPFQFEADAEASELGKIWEAQAEEKLNNLTKWSDVKELPSAVLEKNHDLIQRQIKDGRASYKGFHDLGDAYMVEKATGKISKVASYGTTKLHETHDYLLPTDAAKEKAIRAWIESRRGSKITTKFVAATRGRGSRSGGGDWKAAREHPDADYLTRDVNPMKGLLRDLSGTTTYGVTSALEKEARSRLHAEQMQRIRRAGSANEAIEHLMPLAKVGAASTADGMKGSAAIPKDALAMAWARARHLGQLDEKVTGPHNTYAYAGGHGSTVHSALIRMARASGHRDLAEALAETAERHGLSKDDGATLQALAGHYSPSARTLEHIKKVAGRLGVLDKPLWEVGRMINLPSAGPFSVQTGYGSYMQERNNRKFSDVLNESLNYARTAEAQKEAA